MKLQGLVLVVVVMVAGKAWGQPNASDLTKLQGRWEAKRYGTDERYGTNRSKVRLWRFGKTHLEVTHAGEEPELIPFSLASEGQNQLLILKVLGQKWAGRYKFSGDDTIELRLPRIGSASDYDIFVLERVKEPQAKEDRQITVGRIVIVGNTRTSDEVIRKAVQILPGERVTYSRLRKGEAELARLGIFEVDPRPTIHVMPANDGETTNDLLIRVKEATPK